jgi:formamidopyrimidine-DNA glycosylase
MGQIYYISSNQSSEIVRLENPRPHVIDGPLSLDEFNLELKPFGGEAKGVLTRGKLVAGIGNVHAHAILHHVMIYPFKKGTRLSDDEKAVASIDLLGD